VSRRSARALRGSAFALLATLGAAAAHTLAGGGAPTQLFCLLLAALSAPLATALAAARPVLWRTALAVGGAQALFHAAFATTGDIGAWDAAPAHAHGEPVGAMVFASPEAPTPGAAMTIAHLVAAVVTIGVVHRGEHLARRITAWLIPRMLRRFAVASVRPRPGILLSRTWCAPVPRPRLGARAVARRGPPSPLALATPA
jgi:hypothetical protein